MNRTIPIKVYNKSAYVVDRNSYYVCGNSDFKAVFEFDDDWENQSIKTARFSYEGKYQDVVFEGNECPIPVILGAKYIDVGVFASDLLSSTPARIRAKESIVDIGGIPEAPSPDVYSQILTMIENMGVDEATIKQAVEEYLKNNPIEEHDPTVPEWAKQPHKPTYTADEVGAYSKEYIDRSVEELIGNLMSQMRNEFYTAVRVDALLNEKADKGDTFSVKETEGYVGSAIQAAIYDSWGDAV